jgi:hypothetical protein
MAKTAIAKRKSELMEMRPITPTASRVSTAAELPQGALRLCQNFVKSLSIDDSERRARNRPDRGSWRLYRSTIICITAQLVVGLEAIVDTSQLKAQGPEPTLSFHKVPSPESRISRQVRSTFDVTPRNPRRYQDRFASVASYGDLRFPRDEARTEPRRAGARVSAFLSRGRLA